MLNFLILDVTRGLVSPFSRTIMRLTGYVANSQSMVPFGVESDNVSGGSTEACRHKPGELQSFRSDMSSSNRSHNNKFKRSTDCQCAAEVEIHPNRAAGVSVKASVLMPVYNAAPFLVQAMESILGQSFEDFEFIIVDDGSDDGSYELLTRFAQIDSRIRLFRHRRNMGIVSALNTGLDQCMGEYLVRMDADDIALPDRLSKQIRLMDSNQDIVVLGAAVSYIDAVGKEIGVIRRCNADGPPFAGNPLLHPTVVIRREVLRRQNLRYLERFRYAEDYFLWLQMSRFGTIDAIDDVVIKYRISSSATRVRDLKRVLFATLKVKTAAATKLGLRPRLKDVVMAGLELGLLLLPSPLVLWLYLQTSFGKRIRLSV
jgi:Glycosyl transferase family 2